METLTRGMCWVVWSKLGTMVRDVACRREQWLANAAAGKDFLTSLIEWEIKIAAYEVASGDKISDAVRVATIMNHAPDACEGNALPIALGSEAQCRRADVVDARRELRLAQSPPRPDPDAS